MKKNKSLLTLLAFFIFTILSCKKVTQDIGSVDLGKYYFPTTYGHYVIYTLDSTIYNDLTGATTQSHYQIKETIDSAFVDLNNRPSYYVVREKRADSTQEWAFQNVYYFTTDSNRIEVIDNNLRFVKLKFPVRKTSTWFGNMFIDAKDDLQWYDSWKYQYDSIGNAYNSSNLNFDNTITVKCSIPAHDANGYNDTTASSNLIEVQYNMEKYAKNIGLIYKKVKHWEKGFSGPNNKGYEFELKAIDYN